MLTEVPYGRPTPLMIGPGSYGAMGGFFPLLGTGGGASTAWPSANLALFYPFSVSQPITAVKLWIINGTTASGNLDLGIYDADGTRLVAKGSTAQSGTTAIQILDTTDLNLAPNVQYYMACSMDGTTGTTRAAAAVTAGKYASLGMAQMATAFPLPANATYAAMAQAQCPFFGLSQMVTF